MNQSKIKSILTLISSPKLTVSAQAEIKTLLDLGLITPQEILTIANNL